MTALKLLVSAQIIAFVVGFITMMVGYKIDSYPAKDFGLSAMTCALAIFGAELGGAVIAAIWFA